MTSATPPRESPTLAAALTSATMAASASGSKQRTCDSSTRARSASVGRAVDLADHRPHLDDVADDADAELGEERLADGAGRHPGRGLPGGRPLEDVPGVVEAVLLHPGQVGVAGPGLGERLLGRARRGRHLLLPLGPFGVGDLDGDRGAEGAAVAHPADQGEPVLLEAHPGSPAEPQPPAGQLGLDLLHGDGQAGGQAFEDDDETLPVGLAGGEEAQHERILTVTLAPLLTGPVRTWAGPSAGHAASSSSDDQMVRIPGDDGPAHAGGRRRSRLPRNTPYGSAVRRVALPARIRPTPTTAPTRLAAMKPTSRYHGPSQPSASPSRPANRTSPKPSQAGRA